MATNTAYLVNGEPSALARCKPVCVNADGEVVEASRDSSATNRVFGLVREPSIAAGDSGRIIVSGTLSATTAQWDAVTGESGGLTVNRVYYLGTTGKITAVEGGARIGVALSAYTMALQIGEATDAAADADAEQDDRLFALEQRFAALVMWMLGVGFELPSEIIECIEED